MQHPPFPKANPVVHLGPSRHRPLYTWPSRWVPFPTLSGSLGMPPTCQPHVHLSRWVGAAGRCTVWGQQSRGAGLGGGQGSASAGPLLRDGRDPCTDSFVQTPGQAPRECGEKPCQNRRGLKNLLAHDRLRPWEPLGLESGSFGHGPLPWEALSSERLSEPGGPGGWRRGLGWTETCLAVGRCELSRGQPCQASRGAPLCSTRGGERSTANQPHRPGNGGSGGDRARQRHPLPWARAVPLRTPG